MGHGSAAAVRLGATFHANIFIMQGSENSKPSLKHLGNAFLAASTVSKFPFRLDNIYRMPGNLIVKCQLQSPYLKLNM